MRFKIQLEVISDEKEFTPKTISIRYHSLFLSLFKKGLEHAAPDYFNDLYGTNKEKYFSQALIFHHGIFSNKEIQLNSPKITWLFSTPKADLAMAAYNAFTYLKKMKSLTLTKEVTLRIRQIIPIYQEPITTNTIDFKLISPLIVRDHDRETRKDWFLGFEDAAFETVIKNNLKHKLVQELGDGVQYDIDRMKIEPLKMKKTVTRIYEKFIQGSIGTIRLTGEPYLLNYIRDAGFSSKSGLFCGFMVEV